jgi:hypothetical protein
MSEFYGVDLRERDMRRTLPNFRSKETEHSVADCAFGQRRTHIFGVFRLFGIYAAGSEQDMCNDIWVLHKVNYRCRFRAEQGKDMPISRADFEQRKEHMEKSRTAFEHACTLMDPPDIRGTGIMVLAAAPLQT